MTKYPDLFKALAAQFDPMEVKSRPQGNRQLHYITARTAMNRLDDVLGPENWYDVYEAHENSVLCKLSIRLPDGEWLTKQDAGGYAGMSDSGDDDKSGYSDSFKRACVKFGIARYLYRDGLPEFATNGEPAPASSPARPSSPDRMPSQARPSQTGGEHASHNGHPSGNGKTPRNGRALFAWCKEQEEKTRLPIVKWVNGVIKANNLPARMVDLDESQVAEVHAAVVQQIDEELQRSEDGSRG